MRRNLRDFGKVFIPSFQARHILILGQARGGFAAGPPYLLIAMDHL